MVTTKLNKETKDKLYTFPLLSQNYDGYIVLFTSRTEGTVIHSTINKYPLGYHSNDWRCFESKNIWNHDIPITVELSQK